MGGLTEDIHWSAKADQKPEIYTSVLAYDLDRCNKQLMLEQRQYF